MNYDGFNINDPLEYMNAPAMIIREEGPDDASLPLIVQAAVEYTSGFSVLSADELQSLYAERRTLHRRINELSDRLEVEIKMREAAQSLSKLHAEEAGIHSPTASPSRISGKRLSRLLNSSQQNNEKRLSRQAADEAAISAEKITDLEHQLSTSQIRVGQIEQQILRHHSGVLAVAMSGKPLPNQHQLGHQRNISTASTASLTASPHQIGMGSGLATPKSGRDWKHRRQISTASEQSTRFAINSHSEEELAQLSNRVAAYVPANSTNKVAHVASAFDALERQLQEQSTRADSQYKSLEQELVRKERELQDYELRVKQQENDLSQEKERIRELNKQLKEPEPQLKSEPEVPVPVLRSSSNIEQDTERNSALRWREQAEKHRKQLDSTTTSLEEVTKLAVELEGENADIAKLVTELEAKITELQNERISLLKQRLGATANTSLLCQEFQLILADLVAKHESELRALYPKFKHTDVKRKETKLEPTKPESVKQESAKPELAKHEEKKEVKPESEQKQIKEEPVNRLPKQDPNKEPAKQEPSNYDEFRNERTSIDSEERVESLNVRQASNAAHWGTKQDSKWDNHGKHQKQISQSTITEENTPQIPHKSHSRQDSMEQLSLPTPLPEPLEDTTYDDSIQHTSESLMRPNINREYSEISEVSKSSSYYPNSELANPSQTSFRPGNSNVSLPNNIREQSFDFDNDDIL